MTDSFSSNSGKIFFLKFDCKRTSTATVDHLDGFIIKLAPVFFCEVMKLMTLWTLYSQIGSHQIPIFRSLEILLGSPPNNHICIIKFLEDFASKLAKTLQVNLTHLSFPGGRGTLPDPSTFMVEVFGVNILLLHTRNVRRIRMASTSGIEK